MISHILRNKTKLYSVNDEYFRNIFKLEILHNDGIKSCTIYDIQLQLYHLIMYMLRNSI